ncbi:MAG: GNAT family N-acetyltransferase [Steroidobacteraceae bacterium]
MSVGDGEHLFTARLHLRPPIATDAEAIIAIVGDWEVARRLSRVPHPYGYADFRFFLEQIVVNEPTWAIVLRETNELAGAIGMAPHRDGESAELGYYIARSHWGQGLATEAGQAIVRLGIEEIGYPRLTSGYHADNPASGRVLAKLGFRHVGFSNRECLAEGKDKPSITVERVAGS